MDYVASAVMNTQITTVDAGTSVSELEALFVKAGVNGFPVVDGDQLVGVVSKTDVLQAQHAAATSSEGSADSLCVRDIMTADVVSVVPNANLHKVAELMFTKRLHRILVVEHGTIMGIITPFDFVRLYASDKIGTQALPPNPLDF